MFIQTLTTLLVLASTASAHFRIRYPEMRGDSFATGASQYTFPCANVNQTAATNRTLWPLTGGSLNLSLGHPWTYAFVNLGIGTNYPAFNISLTDPFYNITGNGTVCLPTIKLPTGLSVRDGMNASIQVVTVSEYGAALYNCADITFSSNATALNACNSTPGIKVEQIHQQVNGTTVGSSTASTTTTAANASTTTKASAASGLKSGNWMSTAGVVGLAAVGVSWLL